jgi:site-specific recombinase XerD
MTGQAVCTAIRQVIDKSGVSVCGRRHGAHAMRHSLAARLLENETPIVVISESLGHASSETTMAYLRIDIGGLQKCTLEVPAVQTGFYNQQGGVFYE